MTQKKTKILVVEDEPAILRIIQDLLEEFYTVLCATDGESAVHVAITHKPDLIVIDNLMPRMSGIEAARFIRRGATTKNIPILMLTALKEPVDRIAAFKAGVDDFISKPFHPDDLLARIESKLERFRSLATPGKTSSLSVGNLKLKPEVKLAEVGGQRVPLTNVEFGILRILVQKSDQIVTRSEFVSSLWNDPATDERILDIHLTTLRKKLKKFNRKIETVYGKGYILRSQI